MSCSVSPCTWITNTVRLLCENLLLDEAEVPAVLASMPGLSWDMGLQAWGRVIRKRIQHCRKAGP